MICNETLATDPNIKVFLPRLGDMQNSLLGQNCEFKLNPMDCQSKHCEDTVLHFSFTVLDGEIEVMLHRLVNIK